MYHCVECDQTFSDGIRLFDHLEEIHSIDSVKERHKKLIKFNFTECEKNYTENKNLRKHLRNIHDKYCEKLSFSHDFKCTICEKSFTRRNNLLRYIRTAHIQKMDTTNCSNCVENSSTRILREHEENAMNNVDVFEGDTDKNLLLDDLPILKKMLPRGYHFVIKEYTTLQEENFE